MNRKWTWSTKRCKIAEIFLQNLNQAAYLEFIVFGLINKTHWNVRFDKKPNLEFGRNWVWSTKKLVQFCRESKQNYDNLLQSFQFTFDQPKPQYRLMPKPEFRLITKCETLRNLIVRARSTFRNQSSIRKEMGKKITIDTKLNSRLSSRLQLCSSPRRLLRLKEDLFKKGNKFHLTTRQDRFGDNLSNIPIDIEA